MIDDDFELTEKICSIFMRQIVEGVQYMHDKYIMHLDMKPENILCVTRTGNRIKLIDFGLARRYDPARSLQVMFGTPDFAAPEVLSYERVTPAADMWSVGVICYVLLSGLSPFMGNSDLETMTNVTRAVYDFDDDSFDPISEEAKDFIAKLLIKDPSKRLKPADCLQHKWLAKTPAKKGKVQQLDKTKLKKYVVRRRWQKAVTAIMALSRMGANLGGVGAAIGATGRKVKVVVKKKSSSSSAATKSSAGSAAKSSTAKSSTGGQAPITASSKKTTTTSTVSSTNPNTGVATNRTSSTRTTTQSSSSSSSSSSAFSSSRLNPQTPLAGSRTSSYTTSSSVASRFGGASSPTFVPSTNRTATSSSSYRIESSSMSTTRRKF